MEKHPYEPPSAARELASFAVEGVVAIAKMIVGDIVGLGKKAVGRTGLKKTDRPPETQLPEHPTQQDVARWNTEHGFPSDYKND